jgi:hypothetical protein
VNTNNQHLAMELDTGSPISAISDNLYKNLFSSEHLEPATLNLKTYTGTTINTLGKIRIKIEVNNVKASFDLYVIVNGGPSLLGRDFIKRFQIPIGINNINMKKNLNSILEENHEVFDDQPGKFKLKKVKLYLQENAIRRHSVISILESFTRLRKLNLPIHTNIKKQSIEMGNFI